MNKLTLKTVMHEYVATIVNLKLNINIYRKRHSD